MTLADDVRLSLDESPYPLKCIRGERGDRAVIYDPQAEPEADEPIICDSDALVLLEGCR